MARALDFGERWHTDDALKMDLQRYSRESLQRTEMISFLKRDYPHFSWSLRALDRRLKYFGVRFIDRNVTVEQGSASCARRVGRTR